MRMKMGSRLGPFNVGMGFGPLHELEQTQVQNRSEDPNWPEHKYLGLNSGPGADPSCWSGFDSLIKSSLRVWVL